MKEEHELDIEAAAQMAATEARHERTRKAARPPSKSTGRSKVVLIASLIALLATSALNIFGGNPLAVEMPKQTRLQEAQSRAEALAVMSDWVAGYRAETGHLPADEGAADGPWTVAKVDGEHYEVVLTDDDETLVHSSADGVGETRVAHQGVPVR